ncbi:MAG: hypothetical protein GEU81_08490 [Nitriliruptorales bacterium]|nr:hypothetical protein [Nitriliruptorales bacterium]
MVQAEVLADHPALADDLVNAFGLPAARQAIPYPRSPRRRPSPAPTPFAYTYGDAERHALQQFIAYHVAQGLIERPFGPDALFTVQRWRTVNT